MENITKLPFPHAFVLDARKVTFMARLQSTEQIRYYTNGIHIEPWAGGCRMTATDGCRAGMMIDGSQTTPVEFDAIVRFPKAALKAWSDGSRLYVDPDGIVSALEMVRGRLRKEATVLGKVEVIDGRFPDVDRIMPDIPSGMTGPAVMCFSAAYLGTFAWSPTDAAITITSAVVAANAPALIRNTCPDFIGLLMPARFSGGTSADISRWLRPTSAQAQAA